jgi:hypothetical protein
VPAAWVTGDEIYGNDGRFRRWLEGAGRPYVLAVARSHMVWSDGLVQRRVEALVADLPAEAWHRIAVGAGSKGPRLDDWACGRLPSVTAPGWAQWLLVRRSLSEPDDLVNDQLEVPENDRVEIPTLHASVRPLPAWKTPALRLSLSRWDSPRMLTVTE